MVSDDNTSERRTSQRPHRASIACSVCSFQTDVEGATLAETHRRADARMARHERDHLSHEMYLEYLDVVRPTIDVARDEDRLILFERHDERHYIASRSPVDVER